MDKALKKLKEKEEAFKKLKEKSNEKAHDDPDELPKGIPDRDLKKNLGCG